MNIIKSKIIRLLLATAAAASVAVSAASCGGSASGSIYTVMDEAMCPIFDYDSDKTKIVYNANVLDDTIEGAYTNGAMSYNGSGSLLIASKTLYAVTAKGADKVADDVKGAAISVNGNAIAYFDDMSTLYLYDIASKKSTRIADDVNTVIVSPSGKVLLYISGGELYAWMNGKSNMIAKGYYPLSATDDGKCIYVYNEENDGLYITDATGENKEKIASDIEGFIVNETGTELIYYTSDEKAYITVNGKEPTKLANVDNIDLITPPNSSEYVGNYMPVKTFTGSLLYTYDSSEKSTIAGYVNKDNEYVKIAKDVSSLRVNQSADELYYMKEDVLYKASASKSFEPEKLANDVEGYDITSDGKFVYYINIDSDLFSIDNKGNSQKVASDVGHGDIAGGIMYFVDSEGTLYKCSNGKDKEKIDDEVSSVEAFGNMIAYYKAGDDNEHSIYFSMDGKKFNDVKYTTKSNSTSGGNNSNSQTAGGSAAPSSSAPATSAPSAAAGAR